MDPPTDDDYCGQHECHPHDPQTGQKRPADQLNPVSSPDEDGRNHKQIKQETQSEVDLVAYFSPNDHGGKQSPIHDNPNGTSEVVKSIADSTEDPASSEDHDITPEHLNKQTEENNPARENMPVEKSKPNDERKSIEELQGSGTFLTGESLASEPTPQTQDVQPNNLTSMSTQIHAVEDDNLAIQKKIVGGSVENEKKLPDMDDYNESCAENTKLRMDNAKLQNQCQDLCNQIVVLQSNRPQSTPDEEEICNHWRFLKFAIHNLTTQQFHGLPRRRATKEHQSFFQPLTPNPNDYLMNASKPLLIEAAVWRMLTDKILNSPTSVYQAAAGDAIQITEDINKVQPQASRVVTVPLYYRWRTLTGQLLHMLYGDNGAYAAGGQCENKLADDMVHMFGRYSSYVGTEQVKQQFLGIIQKAVALAKLMARSESRYVLCPTGTRDVFYGQELDESWMDIEWEIEQENATGNGKVDLVVSPALIKFVMPAEGEIKQESKLLFKARVCW